MARIVRATGPRISWLQQLHHVRAQVQTLFWDKAISDRVAAILNANLREGRSGVFGNWAFRCDGQAAVLAIRRTMDKDNRCVSLNNLVCQVQKDAMDATRNDYISWFPGAEPDVISRVFDAFAGVGESHLRRGVFSSELKTARKDVRKVENMAKKHVAHYDAQVSDTRVTYAEFDVAAESVGRLYERVAFFITGTNTSLCEIRPDKEWEWVFRESLLIPD